MSEERAINLVKVHIALSAEARRSQVAQGALLDWLSRFSINDINWRRLNRFGIVSVTLRNRSDIDKVRELRGVAFVQVDKERVLELN
jgi:hypothetical protein